MRYIKKAMMTVRKRDTTGAYSVYLLRWQLSTPLLWYILHLLASYHLSPFIAASFANLIGGLVFFPLDRYIFLRRAKLDIRVLFHLSLYLGRWQLSNFSLAGVIVLLGVGILPVIIANVIGGMIFFWVDRFIFSR
jgi:hypothetical protein